MERKVLVICVLVGFLGLLSAALAFAAEATRNKLSEDGTCPEQRTPAFGLGLISGLALVMAQIIINSAACCMFCKKRQLTSRCDRTKAMTCFFGSWVTFVIGFVSLFIGAALNEGHWEEEECYSIRPMVFIRAAVLSLASIILGIFYFIIISSAKNMDPGLGVPTRTKTLLWHGHSSQLRTLNQFSYTRTPTTGCKFLDGFCMRMQRTSVLCSFAFQIPIL